MFSVFRCSGSEFSIMDCSGDLLSVQVTTCGQNVQGVQCQGNYRLLPQYNNGYNNYAHMYKHIASFIIAASTGQNCILMLQRASLCAFVWLQICDCYSKKTYAGGCFEPKMTSEAISGQLVSQFFPKCMPPDSQPSRCMHKHTQLLSFPNLKYLSTPLPYQYTMVNTK